MFSRGETQEEMTANPKKYPQGYFKDKPCRRCGELFSPQAPSHLFCSEKCISENFSDKYLKETYNISYEEFIEMYERYDTKCHICGGDGFKMNQGQKFKLAVDHCHNTGKVRGLLCHNCNRGLGLFQDSIDNLKSAVAYLERATTIEITE